MFQDVQRTMRKIIFGRMWRDKKTVSISENTPKLGTFFYYNQSKRKWARVVHFISQLNNIQMIEVCHCKISLIKEIRQRGFETEVKKEVPKTGLM